MAVAADRYPFAAPLGAALRGAVGSKPTQDRCSPRQRPLSENHHSYITTARG